MKSGLWRHFSWEREVCSWGGEKGEVLSLGEWERKRLSGLRRGERARVEEVGHSREGRS